MHWMNQSCLFIFRFRFESHALLNISYKSCIHLHCKHTTAHRLVVLFREQQFTNLTLTGPIQWILQYNILLCFFPAQICIWIIWLIAGVVLIESVTAKHWTLEGLNFPGRAYQNSGKGLVMKHQQIEWALSLVIQSIWSQSSRWWVNGGKSTAYLWARTIKLTPIQIGWQESLVKLWLSCAS